MEYLLDTHTLVWFMDGNNKLSKEAREIISNPNNNIFYSVINLWEILIKSKKDRIIEYDNMLELNMNIIEAGFLPLPLSPRHMYSLEEIIRNNKEVKHNDPFDGALLAQAIENKLVLLTHDERLKEYKEKYIQII